MTPDPMQRATEGERRAADAYILASIGTVLLFAFVMALAAALYASGVTMGPRSLYRWLLREDGVVENLTAILLALAAALAIAATIWIPGPLAWARMFFLLFAGFCVLLALEEISWGQRLFGIESGPFFQTYSDQQEINFHNVMQGYLKSRGLPLTRTRDLAALALLLYGVVLPALNAFQRPRATFRRLKLVVPPPALVPGVFAGVLLCWFDRPTGAEEELGEFLFSLAFFLLVPLWLLQQRYRPGAESRGLARAVPL